MNELTSGFISGLYPYQKKKKKSEADVLGYSDATAINLLAKSHKIFSYFSFPFATHQVFLQVYLEIQHLWKDGYEGLFYYLQCLLLLIIILS